jgi:putative transposase
LQLINLPKMKGMKAAIHRSFDGMIKTVTVSLTPCGHYYVSVLVDETQSVTRPAIQPITPETTIGIDVGLAHFSIDSDGNKVENPRFLKNSLQSLGTEQKIFARKKSGSQEYMEQKEKVARVHERVKNQRKDFNHQLTAKLIKSQVTLFVMEDLNIKGMVRNRKLSRALQDVGWGQFITFLAYKGERTGKTLIKIGRFQPTSKVCSTCGHKMDKMPLSVRQWTCPFCQHSHDRDVNAAKNIREIGLADLLGPSNCVKSSHGARAVSAAAPSKGVQLAEHGSQDEAPTRIALAI